MLNYVSFRDEDHSYTRIRIDDKGEKFSKPYISVTTVIGKFKKPFRAAFWSRYKALEEFLKANRKGTDWKNKYKKEILQIPEKQQTKKTIQEYIRKINPVWLPFVEEITPRYRTQWDNKRDMACEKGTAYHKYRETESYEKGYEMHEGTGDFGLTQTNYHFDLRELADGYHAELLLFNDEYEVAGQADKVWITTIPVSVYELWQYNENQIKWINGKPHIRVIDIDDYKTNEKITTTNKYQNFNHPLEHLPESKFHTYSLQLSMYCWMLEQQGYVIRSLRFSHIKDTSIINEYGEETIVKETVPYIVDYLRDDVILLLNAYKSGNYEEYEDETD